MTAIIATKEDFYNRNVRKGSFEKLFANNKIIQLLNYSALIKRKTESSFNNLVKNSNFTAQLK